MTKPLMMSGFRRQRKLDCSEDRRQKHGSLACIFVVREDLLPAWVPFALFSRYPPAPPRLDEKSSSLCRIVQFFRSVLGSFGTFSLIMARASVSSCNFHPAAPHSVPAPQKDKVLLYEIFCCQPRMTGRPPA